MEYPVQNTINSQKIPAGPGDGLDFCMGLTLEAGFEMFLVVGHIPFEIVLQISYFLMLEIQAIVCLLKDIRLFVG